MQFVGLISKVTFSTCIVSDNDGLTLICGSNECKTSIYLYSQRNVYARLDYTYRVYTHDNDLKLYDGFVIRF